MTFIVDQALYLPHFTIADDLLHPHGRKMNHVLGAADEDIMTMAYAAASRCRTGALHDVDAVLFATNTPVFKNRYHASYLADLLGLGENLFALDCTGTNRAGSDAVVLADGLIQSGQYRRVLVVGAEHFFPPIGSEHKIPFGHGAAAMVLSDERSDAVIVSAQSFSCGLAEAFNYKGNDISYDMRFAIANAYKKNTGELLHQLDPDKIDSLLLNSAYARAAKGLLARSGFEKDQLPVDALIPVAGYLGAAHALARLVVAMSEEPGTTALIDYNNGSNVLVMRHEKRTGISLDKLMQGREPLKSYQDYLKLRSVGKWSSPSYHPADMFSSEMMDQREKDQLRYLVGFKCKKCGKISYLKALRCDQCGSEETGKVKLSRRGTVYSLTSEHYYPAAFPPVNMIVVDLDGGGRVTVQQTDDIYTDTGARLKIGDEVRLVLRQMIETGRKPDYYWKCVKIV